MAADPERSFKVTSYDKDGYYTPIGEKHCTDVPPLLENAYGQPLSPDAVRNWENNISIKYPLGSVLARGQALYLGLNVPLVFGRSGSGGNRADIIIHIDPDSSGNITGDGIDGDGVALSEVSKRHFQLTTLSAGSILVNHLSSVNETEIYDKEGNLRQRLSSRGNNPILQDNLLMGEFIVIKAEKDRFIGLRVCPGQSRENPLYLVKFNIENETEMHPLVQKINDRDQFLLSKTLPFDVETFGAFLSKGYRQLSEGAEMCSLRRVLQRGAKEEYVTRQTKLLLKVIEVCQGIADNYFQGELQQAVTQMKQHADGEVEKTLRQYDLERETRAKALAKFLSNLKDGELFDFSNRA